MTPGQRVGGWWQWSSMMTSWEISSITAPPGTQATGDTSDKDYTRV